MSSRPTYLSDALYAYLLGVSPREPDVLRRLRQATAELQQGGWQASPEQAQFMVLLVELIGAERILEVGTFTGYSTLALARALPNHGRIVTCDLSDEFVTVGRPFWEEAGVSDKIELRLGAGLDSLDALLAEGHTGSFDFIFVDAEKESYPGYYERALELARTGGLMVFDNVLWHGRVIDDPDGRKTTGGIRAFNDLISKDERVTLSMVPIGDGMTLARKR